MKSINEQKPATKNQITQTKPDIIKNTNILEGYFTNSLNGGMIKTICYKPVMAGEKHVEERIKACIKMLTPKTPAYQKLKATFTAYFVPNSRVMSNWDKFFAQKGGSSLTKIASKPTFVTTDMPWIANSTDDKHFIPITDTDYFRDSWMSSYIPKYYTGQVRTSVPTGVNLPQFDILPLRGFKAIYNDYVRNKEYDKEWLELKGDTMSPTEFYEYLPTSKELIKKAIVRGKKQNSYYTDYRTEMLGKDIAEPTSGTNDLITFTNWEKLVAEYRSQAEDSQLNDWDIVSKLRGSKRLTEGKVQMLGRKTVGLNYQAITQTAYNNNNSIQENFRTMGTQGAYSYTEIDIPIYQMVEFAEEGYVHILMQVSADSVYETGTDRILLNVTPESIYRPDMKDIKHDVILKQEVNGYGNYSSTAYGFKRKYSEYFKNPNCIAGDCTTIKPYKYELLNGKTNADKTQYENQRTHVFFEESDEVRMSTNLVTPSVSKNKWQDYTDLLINDNQAILQEVTHEGDNPEAHNGTFTWVRGQNQIFIVGIQQTTCDLPIDQEIKNNYTKWGEK